MAMEERQRQIREGAGLEEGRLNQEFIDLMSKWGPHALLVLAVIMGLYFGYQKWQAWSAQKTDAAFIDLQAALTSKSPGNLTQLAQESGASTAVPLLALSGAADLHASAARTGIPIGEAVDREHPDKLASDKPDQPKAFLTDEQKKQELATAESLYQRVVSGANSSDGQELLAIGALTGLASIAEDRGEMDKARGFYEQAVSKATSINMTQLVDAMKKRIESLDKLKNPPKLLAAADLPGGKEAAKPIAVPVGGFTARDAAGNAVPINMGPNGGGPVPPTGTPAPGASSPSAPAPSAPATGTPASGIPAPTTSTPAPTTPTTAPAEPAKPSGAP